MRSRVSAQSARTRQTRLVVSLPNASAETDSATSVPSEPPEPRPVSRVREPPDGESPAEPSVRAAHAVDSRHHAPPWAT